MRAAVPIAVMAAVLASPLAAAAQSREREAVEAFCSVLKVRMDGGIAAYISLESHRATPATERGERAAAGIRQRIEEDVRRRADLLRLLDCPRTVP